jgi:hypothetical protein
MTLGLGLHAPDRGGRERTDGALLVPLDEEIGHGRDIRPFEELRRSQDAPHHRSPGLDVLQPKELGLQRRAKLLVLLSRRNKGVSYFALPNTGPPEITSTVARVLGYHVCEGQAKASRLGYALLTSDMVAHTLNRFSDLPGSGAPPNPTLDDCPNL